MTIREAFQSALGPRVRFDTPLAPFTTFRVGGKADLFVAPRSVEELQRTLALIRRFDLPWFVLGRGFNVLFSDAGFRGVVISFQEGFGNFTLLSDGVTIEAECGVPVSALVQ
ncbi:MAG: FAD-binding protein, partial [Deltaproteobacteria bacterium]